MKTEWPAEGIMVAYEAMPEAEKIVAWAEKQTLWHRATEKHVDGTVSLTPSRKADGFSLCDLMKDSVEANALDCIIGQVLDDCLKRYAEKYQFLTIQRDSGYDFLRYSVDDRYSQHVDGGPQFHRTLSVLLYLNDDYEGGELHFPSHGIVIKPEKGMVVMFPSNFQYPHEAWQVKRGVKYAVVSWFT